MTAPRQVLPGATYLVTRRCSERRLFLRPSGATNAIFEYLLAVAAHRYGIRVHAYCVMSNHFHLVVTDPDARLPDFHQYLDGLVARAVNASIGHWESFWDPESYSAVRLETAAAVFEKLVYVLANPVAAGLVRRGREWPGLWSEPSRIGMAPLQVERPSDFFRSAGPMPASVPLPLHRPPGFERDEELCNRLLGALFEAEDRAAAEHARDGRPFVGRARILAQKPYARPSTFEPRRTLNPSIASRVKWMRIEALVGIREFRRAYRDALAAWTTGMRDVLFPWGTWLMRVRHAVRCAVPG